MNIELTEQHPLGRHPYLMQGQTDQATAAELVQRQVRLADRLQHGDNDAAEELASRYYQKIYLYLRELGHSRETSEDLTQEAFFRAWHHIGQLRNGRALSSWLFRIASNVSCEYWRKQHRRDNANQERLNLAIPNDAQRGSQTDHVGHLEEMAGLLDAVGDLSWKLRQAVVLHYLQGFSISAAAEVAGIKEGTFKSRLNRALEALRTKLDVEGQER